MDGEKLEGENEGIIDNGSNDGDSENGVRDGQQVGTTEGSGEGSDVSGAMPQISFNTVMSKKNVQFFKPWILSKNFALLSFLVQNPTGGDLRENIFVTFSKTHHNTYVTRKVHLSKY